MASIAVGRLKLRWEDDIVEDLRNMKLGNWLKCKRFVEKAKNVTNKVIIQYNLYILIDGT